MNTSSEIIFEYLREIFYDPSKAVLDIDKLDEDFVMLGKGLMYFAQCFAQYNELALALANGDLSMPLPPPENELAAPLKSLHASLKHLTWQSKQVAMGDYKQRVDFMGEFSDSFNTMVKQLANRQQKLEDEIDVSRKKTMALEQSNKLLSNITQNIPQQIIVVDKITHEVLFINDSAKSNLDDDAEYIDKLLQTISEYNDAGGMNCIEIQYIHSGNSRYLSITSYDLEWNNSNAKAFVVNDISAERNQIKELEIYAYRDTMTKLNNRFFGMLTLDKWLNERKQFSLVFVDLDNLKYINDKFGHNEGDMYIINVANNLKLFSTDAVVCRIGGDEFMLLLPDMNYDETFARMADISERIHGDEYISTKDYFYSVSYGVVSTDKDSFLSSSDMLSLADERMYEHKRSRKKNRQEQSIDISIS